MATPADRIVVVLTIAIVLLAGTAVLGALDSGPGGEFEQSRVSVAQGIDGTDWAVIDDAIGENETVYQTRGSAVRLNGAPDSRVETDSELSIATDDTWTVCTWARVQNASADMTVLSANGRVVLGYNGSATDWTLWYYDDGSTSSWRLNTSAATPGSGLTQLCGWQSGNELRFYVNATRVDGVSNVTAENVAPGVANTSNWNGTVEETRTFDTALNASQRNATVNDPAAALPNATRTARMYYDVGAGSTVHVWFADTDATLTNGTWVAGFGEVTVSESGYEWRRDNPEIRATSASILDGAPVAWVDYDKTTQTGTAFERVLGQWSGVSNLVGAIMLVIVAAVVLTAVQRMNDAG